MEFYINEKCRSHTHHWSVITPIPLSVRIFSFCAEVVFPQLVSKVILNYYFYITNTKKNTVLLFFSWSSANTAKYKDEKRPTRKSGTRGEKPRSANQLCDSTPVTSTTYSSFSPVISWRIKLIITCLPQCDVVRINWMKLVKHYTTQCLVAACFLILLKANQRLSSDLGFPDRLFYEFKDNSFHGVIFSTPNCI